MNVRPPWSRLLPLSALMLFPARDEGMLHPVAVSFTFGRKPVVGIRPATREH